MGDQAPSAASPATAAPTSILSDGVANPGKRGKNEHDTWNAYLLWGGIAFMVMATLLIAFTDSSDIEAWPKARSLDDPMVLTHVLAIGPIVLALQKDIPLTTGILVSSTIASFFYHLFMEEETNSALVWLDTVLAVILFCLTVLLLITGMTFPSVNWHLVAASFVIGAMAIYAYWVGHEGEEGDAKQECLRHRMHPMWHCLGFIGVSLVIWNFTRDERTSRFSHNRWVYMLQTFSF